MAESPYDSTITAMQTVCQVYNSRKGVQEHLQNKTAMPQAWRYRAASSPIMEAGAELIWQVKHVRLGRQRIVFSIAGF